MVKSDTDEQCVICDDLKSLYKKICASCFLRGFQLDGSIVGIKPNEVYLHIINRNFNNFTFKELEPIKHLKTYLFDIFIKKTHFDPLFESKCGQCEKIYDRDLSYEDRPHKLICKKCGPFCSNCSKGHHSSEDLSLTCEQFSEIIDVWNSEFIREYMRNIREEKKDRDRILTLEKLKVENIESIKKLDLKICPYTDYDFAKKYEEIHILKSHRMTDKYNKDNWSEVACKSQPIFKTDCDDVVCAKHNPEREIEMKKNGITIGTNQNGCGRRINWNFWKIVDTSLMFSKIDLSKAEKSNLVSASLTNYEKNSYKCFLCKNKTKLLFCQCMDFKCSMLNKKICMSCYLDGTIKRKVISFKFTFQDKEKRVFHKANPSDDFYTEITDNGSPLLIFLKGSVCKINKNRHSSYFGYGNIFVFEDKSCRFYNFSGTDISELMNPHSKKAFYASKTSLSFKARIHHNYNEDIDAFLNCRKNNHILRFSNITDLKQYILNLEEFTKKNDVSKRLNKFFKKYITIQKWKTIYESYKKQWYCAIKINKSIKSYIEINRFRRNIIQSLIDFDKNKLKIKNLEDVTSRNMAMKKMVNCLFTHMTMAEPKN